MAIKNLKSNTVSTVLIKHRSNLSQSAALNSGISHAKYENIIIMDGDLQNDPEDLLNMINDVSLVFHSCHMTFTADSTN